jgi:hypothetical protein
MGKNYDDKLLLAALAALPSVIVKYEDDARPAEIVDRAVEIAKELLVELGYKREQA